METKLSPNKSVKLEWSNGKVRTFIKEFSIDNKYLITVNEHKKPIKSNN